MMRKIFFTCMFLLGAIALLHAQKKIVLEHIRYRTAINYLQQPELQRLFASNLNSLLIKHIGIPLADTSSLPLVKVVTDKDLSQKYDFRNTDSSIQHLVIDIAEVPVTTYFLSAFIVDNPSVRNAAKTVFSLTIALINANNAVRYNEPLYMVINNSVGPGMGNESTTVKMLPRVFVETMKAGLNIALNPANELEQVTITVAPAFAMDNYLVPALANQPRIYVDTSKQIFNFFYNGKQQMLRHGQSTQEYIAWKGKNAQPYPAAVTRAIQRSSSTASSVFFFLREEERDVLNNKNYQLQLMVQAMPDDGALELPAASNYVRTQLAIMARQAGNYSFGQFMSSKFLDGPVHLLLDEKDTLAIFNIEKDRLENDKLVFPGLIYNGVDTNSITVTDITEQQLNYDVSDSPRRNKKGKTVRFNNQETIAWPAEYPFTLTGKLKGHDLIIKCGGFNRDIKEFYLDNKLVCVGQGKAIPEKFVLFDASLPTDLLNPMLLLGFNNYFL